MKNVSRAGRARRLRWGAIGLLVWALVACGSGGGSGTDSASDPGTVAQVREEWIGPELDPVAVLDCPIPSRDGPPGVACYADVTTWLPQSVRSDGAGGLVLAVHAEPFGPLRLARVNAAGERRTLPEVSVNGHFDVAPDGTVWMLRYKATDDGAAPGAVSGEIQTLSPDGRLSVFSKFESLGFDRPPGEGELSPVNLGAVSSIVVGNGVLYVGSRYAQSQYGGPPLVRFTRWARVDLTQQPPQVKALPSLPEVAQVTIRYNGAPADTVARTSFAERGQLSPAGELWVLRQQDHFVDHLYLSPARSESSTSLFRWSESTGQWLIRDIPGKESSYLTQSTPGAMLFMSPTQVAVVSNDARSLILDNPGQKPTRLLYPPGPVDAGRWGADGPVADIIVSGIWSPTRMPDGSVVFLDPEFWRLRRWKSGLEMDRVDTWSGPVMDSDQGNTQWRSARLVGRHGDTLWYWPMADVPRSNRRAPRAPELRDRLQHQGVMALNTTTKTARRATWFATDPQNFRAWHYLPSDQPYCFGSSGWCPSELIRHDGLPWEVTEEASPRLVYEGLDGYEPVLRLRSASGNDQVLFRLRDLPGNLNIYSQGSLAVNDRYAVLFTRYYGSLPGLLLRIDLQTLQVQALAQGAYPDLSEGTMPLGGRLPVPVIPQAPEQPIDFGPSTAWIDRQLRMVAPGPGREVWLAGSFTVMRLADSGSLGALIGGDALSNPGLPAVDGRGQEVRFGLITRIRSLPDGRLLVVDRAAHALRVVTPEGQVSTLYGSLNQAGVLNEPYDALVDGQDILVTQASTHRLLRLKGILGRR